MFNLPYLATGFHGIINCMLSSKWNTRATRNCVRLENYLVLPAKNGKKNYYFLIGSLVGVLSINIVIELSE